MAHRKTLSLSEGDLLKLEPLLKKHNGNFSAAVRELVAVGDILISRFGSIEDAVTHLHPKKSLSQELVENRYGILLPYSLAQWGLRLLDGFLPPKSSLVTPVHDTLAQSKGVPLTITPDTCTQWEDLLNDLYPQLGWEVKITLESTDNTLMVSFSGLDPEINRLAQMVLSVKLAFQDPPYKIQELREYLPLVTIYFEECSSQTEAMEQLEYIFHYQKELYELFKKHREQLSKLASVMGDFNYDVIVLPSEYMEELLSGSLSLLLLKFIQRYVGKSVSELSTKELLEAIEEVNKITHLYKKMERENNRIVFFHSYDNPDSAKKLGTVLLKILGQVNLSPSLEIAENMLVFKTSPVTTDKPKLLIGEEKLDALLSLKYELESQYQVVDAQDGYDILEKAQEHPEVILLNATLPKMDGAEVCAALKGDQSTAGIPVILMIPPGKSVDRAKIGADNYITKPFELEDLRACVNAVLNK
ncbi:MAG: response regulator [Candidatus Methanofastidiosia archaeon]|jgi:CheY-like chemotaxis protein